MPHLSDPFTALGHYQIHALLGEGGFARVYAAWDNKLCRDVAIKRLKQVDSLATTSSIIQEARLSASLKHPAFVKIHALEDDSGSASIVMELVRGQTLKHVLCGAPLPPQQALAIARDIAEAMCEAHDAGLTHGDLKPSNLMLEPCGNVRILDFGLAVSHDAQATVSMANADPQGTIAYMAPERLRGGPLTALSDIYALGAVLFELLTGARPFAHLSGLALAAAHLQFSSAHWHYPATLDARLATLVRQLAAEDGAQRIQTMREAHRRLCEVLVHGLDALPHDPAARAPAPGQAPSLPAAATPCALPAIPALPALPAPRASRRLALALGAAMALGVGTWLAAPYAGYLAATIAPPAPFVEALEMRRALEAVKAWDRRGGLDDAEARFGAILRHNPANAAAVAGLSLVYSLRYWDDNRDDNWRRKASAAAQQASTLNDQLALAHVARGNALATEGQSAAALAAYERALALDGGDVFALSGKVQSLRKLNRADEALRAARANLARHPGERVFADQIGSILFDRADFAGAERAFRDSVRIQPDAVFAYANLSAALLSQGKTEPALQALQQGLQIRPSAWLYGNLGNVLFLREDYVGAAAAFEAAVSGGKGNPGDYLGWSNLGDALLWLPGRQDEARDSYRRAIALLQPRLARDDGNVRLVSQMALYLARTGERARSGALLQRALRLGAQNAQVQFRAGVAYELIGDRPRALAAIGQARRLGHPLTFIETAPELTALRLDPAYLRAAGLP